MYSLPNYGRGTPVAKKVSTLDNVALITRKPSGAELLKRLAPKDLFIVSQAIAQKTLDVDDGIDQFSPTEQAAIRDALATGDFSALNEKHIAWIETQVAKEERKVRSEARAEQQRLRRNLLPRHLPERHLWSKRNKKN